MFGWQRIVGANLAWMLAFASGGGARADLALTPVGQAQGLSVSTFASNLENDGFTGPIGMVFPAAGGVLVSTELGGVRLFPTDTDGQNATVVPTTQNYGTGNSEGLARIGNNLYLAQAGLGRIAQVNANGAFVQTIVSGIGDVVGLVVNPANGHLFATTFLANQILDIDPVAKTSTLFHTASNPDGLILSPDGKTLYVAATGTGHILGFDTATGASVFDSGLIQGGIDGLAVGTGQFANLIFANLNNGSLIEVDILTKQQTVIADGGSRGDFVAIDPNDGTLLLTQTDQILRLSGATFLPAIEAAPEPATITLFVVGVTCVLAYGWWVRW
jgi:DNA-binding beta-propeller fold protein YncE